MTRSSKKELVQPYEEPKRVLRSIRRLFKTRKFDYSSSLEFDLFDHENHFEEEITETMAKTMEQYITKTQDDYGSRIARPKFDDKAKFEMKGQFLKELRKTTFSRSDNEDANEHIERVLEITDLLTVPDVTQDQLMLRIFSISLTRAVSRWIRNKPTGSITTWEIVKGKFLSKYYPLARTAKKMEEINNFQQEPDETLYQAWERQILDSKGVVPSINAANAKKAIQEMVDYSQKWHNRTSTQGKSSDTSDGLAAIQAQLNNLGRERRLMKKFMRLKWDANYAKDLTTLRIASTDAAIRNQGASIKALEIQIGRISKLIIELADRTVKRSKGLVENVLVGIDKFVFPVDFVILDMLEDPKIPLILGRPFLSTAHAKTDVFKRKNTLRVGNDRFMFKSNNLTNHIAMKVYALGLMERMELDLEARLMGETLFLNRLRDLEFGDYIELNDLNEPLELRNHVNEDLGPTINEGEVIDELNGKIVKTRNDNVIIEKIDEYPSYEHVDANFFPILSINVMSKNFYNSKMKDKIEYKGKNVVGAFINVPIFIGKFSIITDFAVVENMDNYRDEGMGDIIVGKPFCREKCVDARRLMDSSPSTIVIVV
ncbi:putative reverse transcriptase domain-containing protein [Tanacetum coccineum]